MDSFLPQKLSYIEYKEISNKIEPIIYISISTIKSAVPLKNLLVAKYLRHLFRIS